MRHRVSLFDLCMFKKDGSLTPMMLLTVEVHFHNVDVVRVEIPPIPATATALVSPAYTIFVSANVIAVFPDRNVSNVSGVYGIVLGKNLTAYDNDSLDAGLKIEVNNRECYAPVLHPTPPTTPRLHPASRGTSLTSVLRYPTGNHRLPSATCFGKPLGDQTCMFCHDCWGPEFRCFVRCVRILLWEGVCVSEIWVSSRMRGF
jgi:hypothetical protein